MPYNSPLVILYHCTAISHEASCLSKVVEPKDPAGLAMVFALTLSDGIMSAVPHRTHMKRTLVLQILLLAAASTFAFAIPAPTGVISLAGDQSVVLHWDRSADASLAGYRAYRSTTGTGGPFSLLNSSLLTGPGYCDLSSEVVNGQTNFYYVTAVDTNSQESPLPPRWVRCRIRLRATMSSSITFSRPASITFGIARIRPMGSSRIAAPATQLAASPRWDLG